MLEAMPTLFAQRPFVFCALYVFFFKYVARGSSAAHLELQVFLQCSSILTALLTAGTESTQLGGVPRCSDNITIYLFIKRTFLLYDIFYKIYLYFIMLPALITPGWEQFLLS